MNFTLAPYEDFRIITDRLTEHDMVLTFQSNEYINQVSIRLSREQAEDLMKKMVQSLPCSEELVQQLFLIARGKSV